MNHYCAAIAAAIVTLAGYPAADEAISSQPVKPFRPRPASNLFHLRHDHVTAAEHRVAIMQAFQVWAEISSVTAAG